MESVGEEVAEDEVVGDMAEVEVEDPDEEAAAEVLLLAKDLEKDLGNHF